MSTSSKTLDNVPAVIGTRKRTTSSTATSQNLPAPRRSKALKPVSPPLSKFSFKKFIYTLVLIISLVGGFYGYRMVQHKREVGGWWNLIRGKGPVPGVYTGDGGERAGGKMNSDPPPPRAAESQSVEGRINALAEALGMPSLDLARAIAGAVRHFVPPASLSSVAAKETGEVIQVLLNEEVVVDDGSGKPMHFATASAKESSTPGMFEGMVGSVENFVGMDEP
jgi:hypothetical protein